MLHAVPDRGRALAAKASQISGCRVRNDRIRLFRLPILEDTGTLEYERAFLVADSPDDSLETNEGGRAVAAIHHRVFDLALSFDVPGERLLHAGACELGLIGILAVR